MTDKMIEMDYADVRDFYEENRIEMSIRFATERNKENELFTVASQKEATVFFEEYLKKRNIKLNCTCTSTFGYMLVYNVDSMKLG